MKRCFCDGWGVLAEWFGDDFHFVFKHKVVPMYEEAVAIRFCPLCGSKLTGTKKEWAVVNAPSASVAKRLSKQMPGEDVPVNWFDILP